MINTIQKLKNKKGFTMVELIVVIAIIAVLAAIIVPLATNYLKQARQTSADSTASSIRQAITIEIQNRLINDNDTEDCIIVYDFSKGVIDSTGSSAAADATQFGKWDVKSFNTLMTTMFPDAKKGHAIILLTKKSGAVFCEAVLYSATYDTLASTDTKNSATSTTKTITLDGVTYSSGAVTASTTSGVVGSYPASKAS